MYETFINMIFKLKTKHHSITITLSPLLYHHHSITIILSPSLYHHHHHSITQSLYHSTTLSPSSSPSLSPRVNPIQCNGHHLISIMGSNVSYLITDYVNTIRLTLCTTVVLVLLYIICCTALYHKINTMIVIEW